MAAILPSLKIDSDAMLLKYFMKHQATWITDESRMLLAEKSVRIGWTYSDAFKNVRKRLRHPNRHYLFCTKDQRSAIEYMETCLKFAEIFNFARSIVSHGMDSVNVAAVDDAGKKFTEEVKFAVIKFDNGSKIMAFSANPYAMAVFEGDVGLDEFSKHKQAEKLWETAQGRITWGYDAAMWSAHDGTDTLFYQFSREATAGKGGWVHYKATIVDAIEMGLVEKINETRGTNYTREQFLADCRTRARLPEIFEQAYMCNPCGSTSSIVSWPTILSCCFDYQIARLHLEAHQVTEIFGTYEKETAPARERLITIYIQQIFGKVFADPQRYRLGFDVAASGQGDLASIYVDRKMGDDFRLAALFTCRTDDWHFLKRVLWTFHENLSALKAAGDETGLGRQICWETKVQFPGIFTPVNFRGNKHKMGLSLMNQLQVAEKQFPRDQPDIAQDYFGLRKIWSAGQWVFSESRNMLNTASHCDIAWSGALASSADEGSAPAFTFPPRPTGKRSRQPERSWQ